MKDEITRLTGLRLDRFAESLARGLAPVMADQRGYLNALATPRVTAKPRTEQRYPRGLRRLLRSGETIRDLFASGRLTTPSEVPPDPDDGFDPYVIGYDGAVHNGYANIIQQTDVLDHTSGGNDSIAIDKSGVVTRIHLVADPYRHDVTTATIVLVQDAADKLFSALSIVGGATFFSLNNTPLHLKALGNQNKLIYGGGVAHEDMPLLVAADNDTRQAWWLNFGLDDYQFFDPRAGIPAEDLTELNLRATFGTNQLIAETAANGTIDDNTDVYALVYSISGLGKAYRDRLPTPDFQHQHNNAPASTTTFDLATGRYLKRTTVVNLAVAANNNEARDDANITSMTIRFKKGQTTTLIDAARWHVLKNGLGVMPGPENDRDGGSAVSGLPPAGVLVIDWRKLTGNPYGLDLTKMSAGEAQIEFVMGTTTGSIHLYNEMYNVDPAIAGAQPPFRSF